MFTCRLKTIKLEEENIKIKVVIVGEAKNYELHHQNTIHKKNKLTA